MAAAHGFPLKCWKLAVTTMPVRRTSNEPVTRTTWGRSFGRRPCAFVRSFGSRPNNLVGVAIVLACAPAASSPLDAGWEFRLATKTNPLLPRYYGGTYDGRFMYFSPSSDNGVTFYLRYDTLRPFDDDAAWTAVESTKVLLLDANHAGAIFDGKYVYYPPTSGRAVRYRARDDRAYVSSCSGF